MPLCRWPDVIEVSALIHDPHIAPVLNFLTKLLNTASVDEDIYTSSTDLPSAA